MDNPQQDTRFVIIGGSFAGIKTAHGILKQNPKGHVTLINPSSQFFYNIASPRILAKPDAFRPEQYLINIPNLFAHHDSSAFRFVEGLAATIDQENQVVRLVGRKGIPYDYLVIASPKKKIATARDIIICGAGPVGVEFAGELADLLEKDKKKRRVTLISATKRVLSQVDERVGCHAMTVPDRLGVEVFRGSRVISARHNTSSSRWTIKLNDGTVMSSDYYISTTGPLPNKKFIPDHFLDDQGWVKVDAHLRAVGAATSQKSSGRVYAIGDIVAHQPRTVRAINEQLPVLLATLEADSQGTSSDHKLKLTYSPSPITSIMIPIGGSSGTGLIFGVVPWEWVVWLIKGRNYLMPFVRWFLSS
ncbi:FAD/NAD(P)-binding domain-containing protein, partial [Aureobasidium melanogenum]